MPKSQHRKEDASAQLAFLLAQVGAHAAARFAERLAVMRLTPADSGIMRLLNRGDGLSQHDLSVKLGIHPSRLVAILDELERRGFVQRKPNPEDRRQYALYLSEQGKQAVDQIRQIGRQHQEALCAALTEAEREKLTHLLQSIAKEQGLTPGVHPGYRRLKPALNQP